LKDTVAKTVPVKNSAALAKALITEMERPTKIEASGFAEMAANIFNVKDRVKELEKLMLKNFVK
jgi:hypothetical protein